MYRLFDMDPPDVDADGIAQNQTLAGPGDLTLNGALVTNGVFDASAAGYSSGIGGVKIALVSAGDISGVNFTVTGTDQDGIARTEVITGVNTTPVQSLTYWATISLIAADAAVGSNVAAGTVDEVATPTMALNWRQDFAAVFVVSSVTGTLSYDIDGSISDLGPATDPGDLIWAPLQASKTANLSGELLRYLTAVRLIFGSYSSGAALQLEVRQQDYNS